MNSAQKTSRLVLTALMMCMIMVLTIFIRIPIPFTQGYVHLGDAMIFLSIMILGWKRGAVAAGIGSTLADIIGGMAVWAPWTLIIKFVMAVIMGFILQRVGRTDDGRTTLGAEIFAMCVAGLWMTGSYYIAEWVVYGNMLVPLAGIPWNIGQFVVGGIIAASIARALCRTPAVRYFEIKPRAQSKTGEVN